MSEVAIVSPADQVMEAVISRGDISKLTVPERTSFYMETCRSLGLNPLTRPFEYLVLNGKTILYARKDCADQLRKLHEIDIQVIEKKMEGDLFCVTVRATDAAGRTDEDMGVVVMPKSGANEVKANMILKAITKAKRRVTLSICGLGFMDESEIDDLKSEPRKKGAVRTVTSAEMPSLTDEASPPTRESAAQKAGPSAIPPTQAADGPAELSLQDMAREAAMRGRDMFDLFYKGRSREEQATLRAMKAELEPLMP